MNVLVVPFNDDLMVMMVMRRWGTTMYVNVIMITLHHDRVVVVVVVVVMVGERLRGPAHMDGIMIAFDYDLVRVMVVVRGR